MAKVKQLRMALGVVVVILAARAAQAADQQTQEQVQQSTASSPATAGTVTREIVVSLEDRKLALVENGQVVKVYPVAVGKPSTPSPTGTFSIARRVENPTYHHDGKTIPPGPSNPVGTRWMGLSVKGYGIHGTNEPKSIGKAASHGCIRMAKADLEELYPLVEVGDTVELVGQRNEETAQLFGTDAPAATPPMELAAKTGPAAAPTTETAPAVNENVPPVAGNAGVMTAAIFNGAL
jgi:lipoprotein-anchoring transpeptidase ErfK/SrfK